MDRLRLGAAALVKADRVVDPAGVVDLGNAGAADEADERARRKGAAAEAEGENLVARLVIEDEEAIGLANVIDQANAHRATAQLRVADGAYSVIVIDDLRSSVLGARPDALGDQDDVGRIGRGELIPRTVEAKDQSFHGTPCARS